MIGSGTTNFLHDGNTEIGEYNASGNIQRRFVPGPVIDQPIAMVTCTGSGCAGANATKTMFHVDKMGSIVAMSNAGNGQLAANGGPYLYDAYGNCTTGGSPCSTVGTPYLFTGQRLDPETGLYYYRARCYSPSLGRFCQTDPVGDKDDINAYLAMHDDPTDQTDPSGMASNGCGSTDKGEKPSSTGTCGSAHPDGGCGSRIAGGGDSVCKAKAGSYSDKRAKTHVELRYRKLGSVAGIDYYHSYVVAYGPGNDQFYTGAFDTTTPDDPGSALVSQSFSGPMAGKPFGNLQAIAGPYTPEFAQNDFQISPAAKIDYTVNMSFRDVTASLKNFARQVNSLGVAYNPLGPNSNTYAALAVHSLGVLPWYNPWPNAPVWVPGGRY